MNGVYICRACLTCYSRSSFRLSGRRTLSTRIVPRSNNGRNTPTTPSPTPLILDQGRIPLNALAPSDISYYWDTHVPNDSQLAYADKFFAPSRHSPVKLWSASKFRTTPRLSTEPEVAFLGRSNVGKSSLLNAIMGEEICWTSSKPGRTREMNAFGIGGTKGGESKVVLLDMPGYGKASRVEWGTEIMKYLQSRKQLRRAFLLIDSLHGLKPLDENILSLFRTHAIPHQIILSKVDRILLPKNKKSSDKTCVSTSNIMQLNQVLHGLQFLVQPVHDNRTEGPGALGEILTCSTEVYVDRKQTTLGVSAVRWAILTAAGFDACATITTAPMGARTTIHTPICNSNSSSTVGT